MVSVMKPTRDIKDSHDQSMTEWFDSLLEDHDDDVWEAQSTTNASSRPVEVETSRQNLPTPPMLEKCYELKDAEIIFLRGEVLRMQKELLEQKCETTREHAALKTSPT